MTEREKEQDVDEGEDADYDPQTQVVGNWKQIDLPQLPVITGEQQEEVVQKYRSKLYRWRKEWKERGVGQLKLLKHKATGLIRLLLRAQKTHKCIANHLLQNVPPFGQLESMKTSNNAWTWAAYDISDQKPEMQKFCAKFTSKQDSQSFKEAFNKACQNNKNIIDAQKKEEKKEEKVEKKVQEQQKKCQDK